MYRLYDFTKGQWIDRKTSMGTLPNTPWEFESKEEAETELKKLGYVEGFDGRYIKKSGIIKRDEPIMIKIIAL